MPFIDNPKYWIKLYNHPDARPNPQQISFFSLYSGCGTDLNATWKSFGLYQLSPLEVSFATVQEAYHSAQPWLNSKNVWIDRESPTGAQNNELPSNHFLCILINSPNIGPLMYPHSKPIISIIYGDIVVRFPQNSTVCHSAPAMQEGLPSHVCWDAHDVPHPWHHLLQLQWNFSCSIFAGNEVSQHGLEANHRLADIVLPYSTTL